MRPGRRTPRPRCCLGTEAWPRPEPERDPQRSGPAPGGGRAACPVRSQPPARAAALRGRAGLEARPRPLPQPPARRGESDPPAAPGSVTGPGPHGAQAPSARADTGPLFSFQDHGSKHAARKPKRSQGPAQPQALPGGQCRAEHTARCRQLPAPRSGGAPGPARPAEPSQRSRTFPAAAETAPGPGALRRCLPEPMERPTRPAGSRTGSAAAAGRERCPQPGAAPALSARPDPERRGAE